MTAVAPLVRSCSTPLAPKGPSTHAPRWRALCRAADGQAGLAEAQGEDAVVLPLGLVALDWLRLYLPLVEAGLPQMPRNAGPDGLGFAGPGFRAVLAGIVPRLDLRVGARFAGEAAHAVRQALQEAADLIARMPATYLTYPNGGGPVLPTARRLAPRVGGEVVLDRKFLAGFGEMRVPRELWRALGRFAAWVEPALVAEWLRLMRGYAERQGRALDEGGMASAMTWSEPSRDVALPRERALALLGAGEALHCVWSGRRLEPATLDIVPLPALDGVAVRRPVEPLARALAGEPAREVRPPARRRASPGRVRADPGLVAAGLPGRGRQRAPAPALSGRGAGEPAGAGRRRAAGDGRGVRGPARAAAAPRPAGAGMGWPGMTVAGTELGTKAVQERSAKQVLLISIASDKKAGPALNTWLAEATDDLSERATDRTLALAVCDI